MTSITCGMAAIRLMEAHGVDTVFGIPGVHTLELYRGLANSPIRHVTPRHEQGAAFMADGYARMSGRPGVCLLTTGPGVTNAATAIAEAYSDSVPMLIISSVNARDDLGQGRGRLHELSNQQAAMAPLCGFSQTVLTPDALPLAVARAFALFRGARPRPVHLEIPLDVLAMPFDVPIAATMAPALSAPDAAAIERAAELLTNAKRPVILAGGGAIGAGAALTALAERVGATVIVTVAAKGTVPDMHALCLGANLPAAPVRRELAAADVVLAIGTEIAETDHWQGRLIGIPGRIIRVDIDAQSLTRDYPPTVAILADAAHVARDLLAALGTRSVSDAVRQAAAARLAGVRKQVMAELTPLERRHMKLLDALRAALPPTSAVAADMTQLAYTANQHFQTSQPRSYFYPTGYGTLGYGLPAGIGAKLADPSRPVVVLVGDGGLQFTVAELASAAELGLGLPIVLWHNDGYGQIRDGMVQRGMPEIGVNIRNPDFAALARAYGCHARRPDSLAQFQSDVTAALAADVPTVIEVREDSTFLA
ncbi:MAG: 5-guanidino-2-oxopentanoate decarboxylase [Alphaproteobacteria bacterium]|nr:5-guanidino-2-oxopentanoate decarboxylase [Alphaproteobacteria bacterium]